MGKRRRNKNNRVRILSENDLPEKIFADSILFEIEENADEIFAEYLNNRFPERVLTEKENGLPDRPSPKKKSGKKVPGPRIDLHGLHLGEACKRAQGFLQNQMSRYQGKFPQITCKIITGKGRHSHQGQAVLASGVYDFVKKNFAHLIISIDPPPLESSINGLPLRGYFCLTLRTNP